MLYDCFFFTEMFAVHQIVAVAPAGGVSPNVGARENDLIEPRLFALLANAGFLDITMDNLAKAGVTITPLMNCMADSREKFRSFVERACHLEDSLADMAGAAKVISVYVASESTTLLEAKTLAERADQDLRPSAKPMDLALHVKTFGKREFVLTKSQTPSQAYFVQKVHESGTA